MTGAKIPPEIFCVKRLSPAPPGGSTHVATGPKTGPKDRAQRRAQRSPQSRAQEAAKEAPVDHSGENAREQWPAQK